MKEVESNQKTTNTLTEEDFDTRFMREWEESMTVEEFKEACIKRIREYYGINISDNNK